ncbi:hypothetical protein [Caenispirillum bisanense]|uniref:Uncharacterized protein n=1 Tax=Caenispirillum bisanense TaxID=414052 RepID=A0A286GCJ0_9PROT|nr:hypothetical protein [Caenispirillum bisanense]SOD93243.1 hypothetical protein SAMN05421508_1031 [Caenispirillum bisanense]
MTLISSAHVGVLLDGILDCAAHARDSGTAAAAHAEPTPACVVTTGAPGERPIAGRAAFESLAGRGWDGDCGLARHPILPLLESLDGAADAIAGAPGLAAADLVAAHVEAVAEGTGAHRVVVVPDTLGEAGQQRLIDGLRRIGISAELLWRPVAALLGWALGLSDDHVRSLAGTTVAVGHAGFWRPEVSILAIDVEEVHGKPYLVPVRSGRGQAPALPATMEMQALNLLAQDLSEHGVSADLAERLVWISRRPWATMCGRPTPQEIVRDTGGRWHRLHRTEPAPAPMAEILAAALAASLDEVTERRPLAAVAVEGPLAGLRLPDGTRLASALAGSRAGGRDAVALPPDTAALGAAHYAWRRSVGIVGYYDSLPDLRIQAQELGRPTFISLMKGRDRVAGGTTVGPDLVTGFSIAGGTTEVDYALSRSDDAMVRKTVTRLPEPADRNIPITLYVTQKPGQGFASVEIRPPEGERLADRPVFLDWSSMTSTGLGEDEYLRTLRVELAWPDPSPWPSRAIVWKAADIPRTMHLFHLACGGLGGKLEFAAKDLMSALGKKPALDWPLKKEAPEDRARMAGGVTKAGVFDSDGSIPAEEDLRELLGAPPGGFKTYRQLSDAVLDAAAAAFERLTPKLRANDEKQLRDLHRQLMLAAAWSYSSTPEPILDYLRKSLRSPWTSLHSGHDYKAAGRCFSKPDDIALLFKATRDHFALKGLQTPNDRAKALSLVLMYRADAPAALNRRIAGDLAGTAVALMEQQAGLNNIKNTFFAAAQLLVGLLRFRMIEPDFLDPERDRLVPRVRDVLGRAKARIRSSDSKILPVLEEIEAFIDRRGTNGLLFEELDKLSD